MVAGQTSAQTAGACRNVKRWRPGDQRERWICSGLLSAESKCRRIDGYRELPRFIEILDARFDSSKDEEDRMSQTCLGGAAATNKEKELDTPPDEDILLGT